MQKQKIKIGVKWWKNPKPIYYLTANARSMRLKLHLVNKLYDDDITKCV